MKTTMTMLGVVLAAMSLATVVHADAFTGNMSATNNYIWRGLTQSNDQAALQGGLDYDFGNNIAIGTWVSNVDFAGNKGTEMDIYGSYNFNLGKDTGLAVGAINYRYPSQTGLDFTEAFAKFSYQKFVAGLYYTIDKSGPSSQTNDIYLTAGYTFDFGKARALSVTYGNYNYDDPAYQDYSHLRVAFTKGEFTAAVDKNDLNGTRGDPRFTVMYTKSFDL